MPHLKELYGRYRGQGLVLIGVHADPNKERMTATVNELKMTWPILFDGDKKVFTSLSADSYPDYYLIDRKGNVRFADLANHEVDRAVEALLKEK